MKSLTPLLFIIISSCIESDPISNVNEKINSSIESRKAENISPSSDLSVNFLNSESNSNNKEFDIILIRKLKNEFNEVELNFFTSFYRIKFSSNLNKAISSRGWGDINYNSSIENNLLTLFNTEKKEKKIYSLDLKEYGLIAIDKNASKIPTYKQINDEGKNGQYSGEVGFIIASKKYGNGTEILKMIQEDKDEIKLTIK